VATGPETWAQTTRPSEPPARVERRILIGAQTDRVWEALTTKALSDDWFPYPLVTAELKPGGRIVYGSASDPAVTMDVLRVQPKRLLEVRLRIHQGPPATAAEPPTRLLFELRSWGPSTSLRLVQDEMAEAPKTAAGAGPIWDANLSRLKTRLETGRRLALSFDEAEQIEREAQTRPTEPETANPLAYPRMITFFTDQFQSVRSWYEDVLRLPVAGFDARSVTLSGARPRFRVEQSRNPSERPGTVLIDYYAPNIDALYARLEARGVKFEKTLTDLTRVKEFIFVSPDGYRFRVRGPMGPPTTRPSRGGG
jgi:uncharacterized protein YndB with AHSA1/START domain